MQENDLLKSFGSDCNPRGLGILPWWSLLPLLHLIWGSVCQWPRVPPTMSLPALRPGSLVMARIWNLLEIRCAILSLVFVHLNCFFLGFWVLQLPKLPEITSNCLKLTGIAWKGPSKFPPPPKKKTWNYLKKAQLVTQKRLGVFAHLRERREKHSLKKRRSSSKRERNIGFGNKGSFGNGSFQKNPFSRDFPSEKTLS